MSLDLAAFIIGSIGLWRLRVKDRNAFIIFTVSNVIWFSYGLEVGSYPMLGMNIVYVFFNVLGYIKWRKDDKSAKEAGPYSVRIVR